MEIELIGPNRDLHSGVYGGAVPNPLNTIVDILSKLHDKDKKISIPGFYDNVKLYSDKERIELKKNSSQDGELFKKDIENILKLKCFKDDKQAIINLRNYFGYPGFFIENEKIIWYFFFC